jgi:1,4-dihydroxy-2-naphthoate octaprenyltransferase
MLFGPVITSTPKKRQAWLQSARRMGSRIATPESRSAAAARRVRSFVAAMRLQMYSFVLFPLLLGSALGAAAAGHFNWQAFAVAAVLGLAAHTAVSFSNQVTDERIDGGNLNRSMFNGGTALLARGRLSRRDLQGGWIAASVLAVAGAALIVTLFGRHWLVLVAGTSGLILGLQYSLAPLRLSRLGLGELAALLAYGVPLLLSGALLQVREASAGSVLTDPRLYLFSLTSVLPIFATLCLTQIPDTEADGRNGKRSVSVLLGPRAVLACTGALLLATGGLLLGFATARLLPPVNAAVAGGIPAAAGLVLLLNRAALKVPAGPRMLNLMGLSVTAAVAASLVPAIHFLQVAGQAAR